MRRRATTFALLAGLWAAWAGIGPARARADDEMDRHLAMLRSQLRDPSLSLAKREETALEMAATLDRAARSAPTAEAKRGRWTEAITLLETFDKDHPGHPQTRPFQFQEAVFSWARGKLWAEQWELAPTAVEPHRRAIADLDEAIRRLRTLRAAHPGAEDLLAQNVRFRLGQALADRAECEPEGSEAQTTRLREAAEALEKPIAEPSLQGYALLLRAEVLARLGEGERAASALEAAAKATPALPAGELLEGRVDVLIARKQFDEALQAIDAAGAGVAAPLKGWLIVRVRLAQRRGMAPGSARREAESALFRAVGPLRGSPVPEARLALLALGRGVPEPDESQDPEAWDALAEGALALGELERASTLEARGADRAEALGRPEQAGSLRLRAGAALFQAGKFLEADAVLGKVADDRQAGPARPRAALLRALARGRALALRLPDASPTAYVAALQALISDFPNDPAANEGRWLLGKLRLARSDRAGAQALWAEIARSDPRWLEARLAVAGMRQDDLDTQRINNDRELVSKRYQEARSFLDSTFALCQTDAERAAIDLARARLELTPGVGHPEEARKFCELIQRSASQAPQRDQARRLHIVAVADQNHFLEAEREARDEARRASPADLLETARLLDQVASDTPSDLRMRRFGMILRVLLRPVLDREGELSADDRAEAHLRETRALLFSGDEARAQASLTSSLGAPTLTDRLLRDLADTYVRLEAFALAATVQRLRVQRAPTGSLPWFEARYGLALAYYRSGKTRDAAKLIDGTAILHPDLGGGDLRDKFIRLRERLSPEE